MFYNLLASGSKGNAVLYHNSILVDCGVPFSVIKPYLYDIQIVLLTHIHSDHFNKSTLLRLCKERPTLRIACGPWMVEHLEGIKNIDVVEPGYLYDYGAFEIAPVKLYHDVPNCGYRIFKDAYKIFHATDTAHLNGITARDYNLYTLEHNYNEETVYDIIEQQEQRGEFAHQKGSINTHLSEQQARDFYYENAGEQSTLVRLHESTSSY